MKHLQRTTISASPDLRNLSKLTKDMKKGMILALPLALALAGCSHKTQKTVSVPAGTGETAQELPTVMKEGQPAAMMPKATAFRMTGDYADHVAVTIGDGGRLTYFPAPTDITANSAPLEIGDGWWLNRQGLGPGSVFTKWTFTEYRALKSVPTQDEIKTAIIPGACVSEFRRLDVTPNEAARDPHALLPQLAK